MDGVQSEGGVGESGVDSTQRLFAEEEEEARGANVSLRSVLDRGGEGDGLASNSDAVGAIEIFNEEAMALKRESGVHPGDVFGLDMHVAARVAADEVFARGDLVNGLTLRADEDMDFHQERVRILRRLARNGVFGELWFIHKPSGKGTAQVGIPFRATSSGTYATGRRFQSRLGRRDEGSGALDAVV